jgi:hypothetical protein
VQALGVALMIRQILQTGEPSLQENRYDARHTLRSVSVVRV